MNTCGTCKHFGDVVDDRDGVDPMHVPAGYHVCRLIEMKSHQDKPTASAIVTDASGYYAALCVREEFGCNQWEANQNPPRS